jgi:cytochrome c peroxidase
VHGDPGQRNVPGLANVAWMTTLTWGNPRLTRLEAQAAVPITGKTPVEMGMAGQESEIARRLAKDDCYRAMFARAFPGGGAIDFSHVAKALAAFERTLVSFDSPYDAWGRGNRSALSPEAIIGAAEFRHSCSSCHSGPLLSDGKFHKLLSPSPGDRGLGEITLKAADNGRFRTPSLRNVDLTAPYFHDGSAKTLTDAVRRHPGTAALSETRLATLSAFMAALTDRHFTRDARYSLPDQACGKPL